MKVARDKSLGRKNVERGCSVEKINRLQDERRIVVRSVNKDERRIVVRLVKKNKKIVAIGSLDKQIKTVAKAN